MKKMYDVCIFDLDGTLADSLGDLASSCNEALSLFDLPTHEIEQYRYFVGNGIRMLIKRSMGEKAANEKLVRSVHNTFNLIYEQRCLEKTLPYSGITELLYKLKENEVKVGVLSNKADNFAKRIVAALFKNELIDSVCGQRDEFPAKPSPESLFAMLNEFGCPRNRCLYIGDSDVDVLTAKNASVDFCGAEWGFRGYDELKKAGAEHIVKNPSQLADLVLK